MWVLHCTASAAAYLPCSICSCRQKHPADASRGAAIRHRRWPGVLVYIDARAKVHCGRGSHDANAPSTRVVAVHAARQQRPLAIGTFALSRSSTSQKCTLLLPQITSAPRMAAAISGVTFLNFCMLIHAAAGVASRAAAASLTFLQQRFHASTSSLQRSCRWLLRAMQRCTRMASSAHKRCSGGASAACFLPAPV